MVDHLLRTGDTGPVRQLYGPRCEFCSAGVSFYDSFLKRGHVYEGGAQTSLRMRTSLLGNGADSPSAYSFVKRDTEPQTQRNAKGKVVNEFPGGLVRKGYFLAFQGGQWQITNVEDPE